MKVAHDLQADDEKVQKKVAKKLARQQVRAAIILPNLLKNVTMLIISVSVMYMKLKHVC